MKLKKIKKTKFIMPFMSLLLINSISTFAKDDGYNLDANIYKNKWTHYTSFNKLDRDGKPSNQKIDIECYALEGINYVSNPLNEKVETMNIYVPKEYMKQNADGTYSIDSSAKFTTKDKTGKTVTYTAQTAPIIYYNTVNGYAQGSALTMGSSRMGGGDYTEFVKQGLILVGVGALGKDSRDSQGNYIGKVPMGLIDLKSGIKYLKFNDKILPGDSNRIVSVGASAGGAMSSLLGATGNSTDYDEYFKKIGAATAKDDIYGAVTYCPITNLDNADSAYEWIFPNSEGYTSYGPTMGSLGPVIAFTDFQKKLSKELNKEFISYVRNLGLDLSIDGKGGAYYEELTAAYEKSIMHNIDTNCKTDGILDENKVNEFIKQLDPNGIGWVKWNLNSKTVKITGFIEFAKNHLIRKKTVPSFDEFNLGRNENAAFGNTNIDMLHFSNNVMDVLKRLSSIYPEADNYYKKYSADINKDMLDRDYLMNPMNYIGTKEKVNTAPYWRINIGSEDSDVGVATGFTMGQMLKKSEKVNVDFNIIWGYGHGPAEYSVNDLINYVNEISNK